MRLVLFKDLLEDEAASQYGIVLDGDEPDVICLCCGSTIEFGDYEILQELTWENLSAVLKVRREAESEEAACYIAAEKYRYDSRCLYATKI